MKKLIPALAIFMTISFSATANTCDQLPTHSLTKDHKSADASCAMSAAGSTRFAGLGGLFGNQKEGAVSVTYQYRASNSRFVGLGGLFGHQNESTAAINYQQMNVAGSGRFAGLGGLFSGQRTTDISQNPALASTSYLFLK